MIHQKSESKLERKKPDLLKFAGIWRDVTPEEKEQMRLARLLFRKRFDEDFDERVKRIVDRWKR